MDYNLEINKAVASTEAAVFVFCGVCCVLLSFVVGVVGIALLLLAANARIENEFFGFAGFFCLFCTWVIHSLGMALINWSGKRSQIAINSERHHQVYRQKPQQLHSE